MLSVDRLERMYKDMWVIRRFEEEAGGLYRRGLIKGGVHPSIGQEAVPVGVCAHLRPDDWITSTHRGHGHHIAKGADPGRLMAEVLAKDTGYCRGRGGSMHVAAFEVGSLGAYPVVAAGVPVGVGAALSSLMQGLDRVVVSFFGDGALGQGTLHESLNLAAVWQVPLVFVCENNAFAVSTRVQESVAARDRQALVSAYGIPAVVVDGQDVRAVYEAAGEAIGRARVGGGPGFLECQTYRYEGHYFGEPQVYRSKEEVDRVRQSSDPIARLGAILVEEHGLHEDHLASLEAEAGAAIETALEFARSSPDPSPEQFAEFVYA